MPAGRSLLCPSPPFAVAAPLPPRNRNTVMYYTPTILELAGFRDKHTALLLALVPAGINALGTLVGVAFIDRFGRRPLLLASVAAVCASLAVLGCAFRAAEGASPAVLAAGSTCAAPLASAAPSCAACLRAGCAFCGAAAGDHLAPGTCLALNSGAAPACTTANDTAHVLYQQGCPSPFTWDILLGLLLYLAAFAPGLGPVPWAVCSEIMPQVLRGLAMGMAATANWLANAVVSQTFLSLTRAIGASGAFWTYAGILLGGLCWSAAVVPETNGLTLEEVQQQFALAPPWQRRVARLLRFIPGSSNGDALS